MSHRSLHFHQEHWAMEESTTGCPCARFGARRVANCLIIRKVLTESLYSLLIKQSLYLSCATCHIPTCATYHIPTRRYNQSHLAEQALQRSPTHSFFSLLFSANHRLFVFGGTWTRHDSPGFPIPPLTPWTQPVILTIAHS